MMYRPVDGVDIAEGCRVPGDEQIGSLRYRMKRIIRTLRLGGLRRASGCCRYRAHGMGGNSSSVSPFIAVEMVCRWRATSSRLFGPCCLFCLLGLCYG